MMKPKTAAKSKSATVRPRTAAAPAASGGHQHRRGLLLAAGLLLVLALLVAIFIILWLMPQLQQLEASGGCAP